MFHGDKKIGLCNRKYALYSKILKRPAQLKAAFRSHGMKRAQHAFSKMISTSHHAPFADAFDGAEIGNA